MAGHCGCHEEMSPLPTTAGTEKSFLPSISVEGDQERHNSIREGKGVLQRGLGLLMPSPWVCVTVVGIPYY